LTVQKANLMINPEPQIEVHSGRNDRLLEPPPMLAMSRGRKNAASAHFSGLGGFFGHAATRTDR
jgi:hypothetical protein